MSAGELCHRIIFERRVDADDGMGNRVGEFARQFEVWAGLKALQGGEDVMAARLSGRQPYVVKVRRSSDTQKIDVSWRIRVKSTDQLLNIKSPPKDPDDKRQFLEMLCVAGEASG